MSALELARRYVKVLNTLPPQAIEELLKQSEAIDGASLETFFYAPNISIEDKKNVIRKAFSGSLSPDALSFIDLLMTKNRLFLFAKIIEIYKDKHLKDMNATIITAVPMKTGAREKWQKKLEQTYGVKISLRDEVNPKILGGTIVIVRNQMLDASLRDRLYHIKKDLLSCA